MNFGKLFQDKIKFLMKTFIIILKANLIEISDNKKKVMLINLLCSKPKLNIQI